ncbi:MAG: hypothetical protein ACRCT8_10770 [Lacipirellulaceae bacterium]
MSRSRWLLLAVALAALVTHASVPVAALPRGGEQTVDEALLCQKLDACFAGARSTTDERARDAYVEQLSFLVLAAGSQARGSERLDATFAQIQREAPTLAVPRFAMSPADLERLLRGMAAGDRDDTAYATYRRRARTISELIADAKRAITQRSGFAFDPTVKPTRSQ